VTVETSAQHAPQVFVIGGPNGAGKTTAATSLLPKEIYIRQFVNADTIAVGLSAFDPEAAAFEAGRVMLARLEALARRREDFAFETTLASRSFAPFLARLQRDGDMATVIYVWLRTPDLAVQRVAERVRRGGHDVPPKTVRRRYQRGLLNFMQMFRPLTDRWVLCDNSDRELVIVARGRIDGPNEILDQERYDEVHRSAGVA